MAEDVTHSRPLDGVLLTIDPHTSRYKTSDGKAINILSNHDEPTSVSEAIEIIGECHTKWLELIASGGISYPNFWLGSSW